MTGETFIYVCECGFSIRAETWDPQELPKLWCPDCGEEIEPGSGTERVPEGDSE